MTHHFSNRIILPLTAVFILLLLGACGDTATTDVATMVDDAEQALADGNPDQAKQICADLMVNSFDRLTENQLGRMAIIYIKLSETENVGENVADATQCVRQAWKLSNDSLRGFISTLPPEDVPYFIMLTRIGGSIDFPPELSEEQYAEDSIHANPQP